MNGTATPRHDSEKIRWVPLSAKEFARCFPRHESFLLMAETLNVKTSQDTKKLFDWIEEDSARIYLKGDLHHANDFYDITERVRNALRRGGIEQDDLTQRLLGRRLLKTSVRQARRPHWWSGELSRGVREYAASLGVEGVFLGDDWSPDFNPDDPIYPWISSLESRVSGFGEWAGWLFETGEPSVGARTRFYTTLRALALDNLAAASEGCRLGVGLPWNRQRPWWLSPWELASRGLVPFLTTTLPLTLDSLSGSEMARLSEMAATSWKGVRSHLWAPRSSKGVLGWAKGGGFLMEPKTFSIEGRPPADVLLLVGREDAWAHGWDDTTTYLTRQTHRTIEMLSTKGIEFSVTDELSFVEMSALINPSLVLVGPCRSVLSGTVSLLREWVEKGKPLGFVEPYPYLVEGKRETSLEALLARRRVHRLAVEDERSWRALFRRARIRPCFRVFDRLTGEPFSPLYRQTLEHNKERNDTFVTGAVHPRSILVELEGMRQGVLLRDGVEIPTVSWHADGNTYFELTLEPNVPYLLRSRPRFETLS